MDKIWSDGAWEDYLYWQAQDKKTLRRVNFCCCHFDERNEEKSCNISGSCRTSLGDFSLWLK